MSKSKEELNKIKEEVEAVNEMLQELTPEELEQISGGTLSSRIYSYDCEGRSVDICKTADCPYGYK